MSLQTAGSVNMRIINIDLFDLLDLSDLDQSKKDDYVNKINALVMQLFLTKVAEIIGPEKREALMAKYNPDSITEDQAQSILSDIGNLVPDASDLYVKTLAQVKASFVEEQYKTKRAALEEALAQATDEDEKLALQRKIELMSKNEQYAKEGNWDAILAANQAAKEGKVVDSK